jgi:serine/threonine protein kinase
MKSLKFHPHLVCLLGYVQETTSPLLILEYCANGDLLQYLRKNKDKFVSINFSYITIDLLQGEEGGLKVKNLTSFAWQISNGLEYLTDLGHIHR